MKEDYQPEVEVETQESLNEEASKELEALVAQEFSETVAAGEEAAPYTLQSVAERTAVIEALIFVSDEPLNVKTIAEVLREDREVVEHALSELVKEFNARDSGL